MRAAAGSPPDGYTLVIAGQGPFALNPHMYENAGYDPIADFAPITLVERGPLLLAVHPAAGVTSVAELVKLAKSRPGAVNMGIPGTGTPPHMANELFVRSMGIEVTEVPYSGAAAAMADLMAGRLTYTFGALNVQLPQVKAGRIRALAVTSAKRMPAWPDIPTVAESGSPEFSYFGWLGLAAPARTPAPVIAKLHAELVKILHAAEAREYFETQGREPVGDTPAEFAAYIKTEYEKWGPIIRAAGIKAE
jgi:tripartite-type tricarboxylate transporter receptor subunit TctC